MTTVREKVKVIARASGAYAPIKRIKDRCYWSLRERSAVWSIRALFPLGAGFARFSREFDEAGIFRRISDAIEAESAHGASFVSGVSNPTNLRALYILCRVMEPQTVIETGVASGASSYSILSALERNGIGRLYSIDLPPDAWAGTNPEYRKLAREQLPTNRKPGWLVPDGLRSRWELIVGDSRRELPALLDRINSVDLFYHDAEHTRDAMLGEYRLMWPRLRPGGLLASDDVHWNTAFDEFRAEHQKEGASRRCVVLGMMRKHPRGAEQRSVLRWALSDLLDGIVACF